ncbi:MAG: hypothetical protein OXI39_10180 [Gemmatimonadota bacterium]|uniref:hypothetical protein n=1 Tax=Candidatus Palauibacter scopulicola TaxID=3056741 RepID=UPI0023958906|nr:hypothetical protein [Candidatus Palauibacter scopulicola]MDE2663353.1 hypothetical protein [Candidatus Palauibacter scopulicola]
MGLDWSKIAAEAAQETDRQLAGDISSLTTMTDREIEELFPTHDDKQRLAELMEIVNGAGSRNRKINRIVDNIEDLAGTVLTIAGKLS